MAQPSSRRLLAAAVLAGMLAAVPGCVPRGAGSSPRELRKDPSLRFQKVPPVWPDSLLPHSHLLDFPFRNIDEIKLSWKVVAGIQLKRQELKRLRELVLANVQRYWLARYPGQAIPSLALENVSVLDAQVLLAAGFPLLLYSAYDIRHRGDEYSFEGSDICMGYQGIGGPLDTRVSFKLNSGLRGYIAPEGMLTGQTLDIPRLKNSRVQVLQVILLLPPGFDLEKVHALLTRKYRELRLTDYTLPVKEMAQPVGSFR